MDRRLSNFIVATQAEFDYFLGKGFVIPTDGIIENQLYGMVKYFGANTCIAFGYDTREKYVDCYVGKVISGNLEVDRHDGGYWAPLETYLREVRGIHKYFPSIGRDAKCRFPELKRFKFILGEVGELILADSEKAFLQIS